MFICFVFCMCSLNLPFLCFNLTGCKKKKKFCLERYCFGCMSVCRCVTLSLKEVYRKSISTVQLKGMEQKWMAPGLLFHCPLGFVLLVYADLIQVKTAEYVLGCTPELLYILLQRMAMKFDVLMHLIPVSVTSFFVLMTFCMV